MKYLILILLLVPMLSYALITDVSKEGLTLAIIQDEFRFDFDNIKNATIIKNEDSTFKGLLVELKTNAVPSLTKMTSDGFNKELMVVFNNKVVSATMIDNPLGSQVLFSGLSQVDAENFLMMLHKKRKQLNLKKIGDNNKMLISST